MDAQPLQTDRDRLAALLIEGDAELRHDHGGGRRNISRSYWRDLADRLLAAGVAFTPATVNGWTEILAPDRLRAAHPGENHEFRTTCLRCGEPGQLHVALIAPDETMTIQPRAALGDAT